MNRPWGMLALSLAAQSCLNLGKVSWDEVDRVSAPGLGVDAVLIETDGGATTSFGYEVYVVPSGQSVERDGARSVVRLYGSIRSDSAYGVTLRWQDATHLSVEYQEARSIQINDSLVTVGEDTILVIPRAGITDSTAPAGGMLWNKQGRRR